MAYCIVKQSRALFRYGEQKGSAPGAALFLRKSSLRKQIYLFCLLFAQRAFLGTGKVLLGQPQDHR